MTDKNLHAGIVELSEEESRAVVGGLNRDALPRSGDDSTDTDRFFERCEPGLLNEEHSPY